MYSVKMFHLYSGSNYLLFKIFVGTKFLNSQIQISVLQIFICCSNIQAPKSKMNFSSHLLFTLASNESLRCENPAFKSTKSAQLKYNSLNLSETPHQLPSGAVWLEKTTSGPLHFT